MGPWGETTIFCAQTGTVVKVNKRTARIVIIELRIARASRILLGRFDELARSDKSKVYRRLLNARRALRWDGEGPLCPFNFRSSLPPQSTPGRNAMVKEPTVRIIYDIGPFLK